MPSILGRMLNYLLTPLYTYNLFPAEYGVVTEMYAYASVLGILLTYGMETTFFRYFNSEEDKPTVFSTGMTSLCLSGIAFLGLVWLFSPQIGSALAHNDTAMSVAYSRYAMWFAAIVVLDAFTALPFALLRATNRPYHFATVKSVNIGTNILLNLFFILVIPNLHLYNTFFEDLSMVDGIFISNLMASVVTLFLLLPVGRFQPKLFNKELWLKMMRYGLPVLVMGLAGMINETFDRILLKWMLPLPYDEVMHQIGVYGACYKLSIIMTICIQAYRFAAEPFFFARFKEEGSLQVYAVVMNYFVAATTFVLLSTLLFMDQIQYFIGSKGSLFLEGLHVVPILLVANLFLGIYYNLSVWFKLTDRTLLGAVISIGGAILTLIINYMLIPVMGYTGSAIATLACYGSMMIASFLWGQKVFPIPYQLGKVALLALPAIVLPTVNFLLPPIHPALLFVIHIAMMIKYFFYAWYILQRTKTPIASN